MLLEASIYKQSLLPRSLLYAHPILLTNHVLRNSPQNNEQFPSQQHTKIKFSASTKNLFPPNPPGQDFNDQQALEILDTTKAALVICLNPKDKIDFPYNTISIASNVHLQQNLSPNLYNSARKTPQKSLNQKTKISQLFGNEMQPTNKNTRFTIPRRSKLKNLVDHYF